MKKLTGVFVIETGVVNRGEGIGSLATVKKVNSHNGAKVYFTPVSYKRALWEFLQSSKNWRVPMVITPDGDKTVIQRTGTIIDSEEFDFAGTMIAIKYERKGAFLTGYGISVNNYRGDMLFMTNMGLSKFAGDNLANIINRENFYGIYLFPFSIELDRVGVQEIKVSRLKEIEKKTEENQEGNQESETEKEKKGGKKKKEIEIVEFKEEDSPVELARKLYRVLGKEDQFKEEWLGIVESITYDKDSETVKIVLKKEERLRRIRDLLEGMGELYKRIEGTENNLSPYYAVFSLEFQTPAYLYVIKDHITNLLRNEELILIDTIKEVEEKLYKFASDRKKNLITTDYMDYPIVVDKIMQEIEKMI